VEQNRGLGRLGKARSCWRETLVWVGSQGTSKSVGNLRHSVALEKSNHVIHWQPPLDSLSYYLPFLLLCRFFRQYSISASSTQSHHYLYMLETNSCTGTGTNSSASYGKDSGCFDPQFCIRSCFPLKLLTSNTDGKAPSYPAFHKDITPDIKPKVSWGVIRLVARANS
jgi:hypothetical protein